MSGCGARRSPRTVEQTTAAIGIDGEARGRLAAGKLRDGPHRGVEVVGAVARGRAVEVARERHTSGPPAPAGCRRGSRDAARRGLEIGSARIALPRLACTLRNDTLLSTIRMVASTRSPPLFASAMMRSAL